MNSVDFSVRAMTPELMDIEPCSFEEFRACLSDLAKVNVLTLTNRPTLAYLDRLKTAGRLPAGRPLRVVDIASGFGDMLRDIDRWAAKHRIDVELTGLDLNPFAAQAAEAATQPGRPIRWVTADLFDYSPSEPPDLVISTQFTHHLPDAALIRFLRWMEESALLGWFVSDLHRHKLPYHFFRYFSRAMGWHRFVTHDGPISITRAFTIADWHRLLLMAGLAALPVEVRWHVPFRITVGRTKPA